MRYKKPEIEYKGLREPLMSLLACPQCNGDLDVRDKKKGSKDALIEGVLHCSTCCIDFPVRRGIPRLMSEDLGRLEEETAKSFGYQWQAFSRRSIHWKKKCREYFSPFQPQEIGKGRVLDAGCGYGRWLYEVSEGGGICIGMDLSDAVFAAADFLAEKENCHLVQGNILRPPFKKGSFDTVYSIGVLHHLPKGAEEGIRSLVPLVNKNGLFFVWLYGRQRGDQIISWFSLVRKVTKYLPKSVMRVTCMMLACVLMIVFIIPKRFLSLFNTTKRISDHIPFHSYKDLPLSELRTDLFDMYATPIEHGYGRGQVCEMLQETGLEGVQVTPYGIPRNPEASWRGWGRRRTQ